VAGASFYLDEVLNCAFGLRVLGRDAAFPMDSESKAAEAAHTAGGEPATLSSGAEIMETPLDRAAASFMGSAAVRAAIDPTV
jgi:hypothetical protein